MALSHWLTVAKGWSKLSPRQSALQARISSDPYYRFQSMAEVAVAAQMGVKIDVNRASVDDWLRLPGISIHQARSLVELAGMGVQLLCVEDIAAALSIPVEPVKRLELLLYFCYYDPQSLSTPGQVNANTASVEQLAEIPLLPPALAARIVGDRQQNGAYRHLADFGQRLALNSQLISQLMHSLKF